MKKIVVKFIGDEKDEYFKNHFVVGNYYPAIKSKNDIPFISVRSDSQIEMISPKKLFEEIDNPVNYHYKGFLRILKYILIGFAAGSLMAAIIFDRFEFFIIWLICFALSIAINMDLKNK